MANVAGLLILILTRVFFFGMYLLMTSNNKYIFFAFVNLLSSSSLNVLWMCLRKGTQKRCFQGPIPFLFSHQTWHILLDCMRGTSYLGEGCSAACIVPKAQAVDTCLGGMEWLLVILQGLRSHLSSALQICTKLFCSPNMCGALLSFITITSPSSTCWTNSIPANYCCSCFPPAGNEQFTVETEPISTATSDQKSLPNPLTIL